MSKKWLKTYQVNLVDLTYQHILRVCEWFVSILVKKSQKKGTLNCKLTKYKKITKKKQIKVITNIELPLIRGASVMALPCPWAQS